MYEHCDLNGKICVYATKSKDVLYCGFQSGENRLEYMKKCPLKKKKVRNERIYEKSS